jgi:hypothetical protein
MTPQRILLPEVVVVPELDADEIRMELPSESSNVGVVADRENRLLTASRSPYPLLLTIISGRLATIEPDDAGAEPAQLATEPIWTACGPAVAAGSNSVTLVYTNPFPVSCASTAIPAKFPDASNSCARAMTKGPTVNSPVVGVMMAPVTVALEMAPVVSSVGLTQTLSPTTGGKPVQMEAAAMVAVVLVELPLAVMVSSPWVVVVDAVYASITPQVAVSVSACACPPLESGPPTAVTSALTQMDVATNRRVVREMVLER